MRSLITCKNCNENYSGNYCPSCGQPASEKRLDWESFRLFYKKLFFNFFDKGFTYSCSQLITRPGHTIREYIEGKRVNHMNPFTLLLSLAGMYGFIYHSYHVNTFIDIDNEDPLFSHIDFNQVNDWISSHFAFATCLLIPIFALGTRLAFSCKKYNYIEFFILNTFVGSARTLIHFVFLPFIIIYKNSTGLPVLINVVSFIDLCLFMWVMVQFYNYQKIGIIIVQSIISYVYIIMIYTLIILGLIEVYNYIYY
jgi:hypothetical protein